MHRNSNPTFQNFLLIFAATVFASLTTAAPINAGEGNLPTAKVSSLSKQSCDELQEGWKKLTREKPKLHRKINDLVDDIKDNEKEDDKLEAKGAKAFAAMEAAPDKAAKKAHKAAVGSNRSERRALGRKMSKQNRQLIALKRQMSKLRAEIEKYDTALRNKGCR